MFGLLWMVVISGILALFVLLASLGAPPLFYYLVGSVVVAVGCWAGAWFENKPAKRNVG